MPADPAGDLRLNRARRRDQQAASIRKAFRLPTQLRRASGINESRDGDEMRRLPPHDNRWVVVANVLFLASIALTRGLDHPTVKRNRQLEPETYALLQKLLAADGAGIRTEQPLTVLLAKVWGGLRDAAAARHDRTAADDG